MEFNMNNNRRELHVVVSLSSFLLLLLLNIFPCEAQHHNNSPTSSPTPPVSYISSSPAGSPSPSPSPLKENRDLLSDISIAIGADVEGQVIKFVEKTVIAVRAKSDEFLENVVENKLSNTQCLKQCEENFESARDDAQNVLDDLSSGDFYKAEVDLDALATDIDTCNDCIKEFGLDYPEINKFDEWVSGITSDCLGEIQKIHPSI